MRKLSIILALSIASNATAQAPAKAPPVVVKRSGPATKANPADTVLQNKIDADLKALREDPATLPATPPSPVVPVAPDRRAPAGYQYPSDLPLSPTAEAAVRVSEKWLTETVTPTPGADGRVLYSYGAGLATVVCAPLRLCVVELQSGERLISEPHIGDSVRWHIAPALFGKGDSSTTVLIVKPQEPGLDTNLLIATDRRIYYLRLLSKPEDYTARVAFAYPDDDVADSQWKEHLAKQNRATGEEGRILQLAPEALESLNFDYQIKGDGRVRPMQVFDDGVKTYIRMNPLIASREAPVLVVVGDDGKPEMLNYRVKGEMYIADRLFDRAQLVLGSGKTALKSEIVHGTTKKKP